MITYNDYSYIETKKVLMGEKKIEPVIKDLIVWINETYSVNAIYVCYEILTNQSPNRPRIEVIFKNVEEISQFKQENGFNYDTIKQNQIKDKFVDLSNKNKISKNQFWNIFYNNNDYETNDLFVVFSAFNPILRSEINNKIQDKDIMQLESNWSNLNLWKVVRSFESVFFMFYSNADIEKIRDSEVFEKMKDEYYLLLKVHDDFNILQRDEFNVVLDSKENFDKNYESNWYYYFK